MPSQSLISKEGLNMTQLGYHDIMMFQHEDNNEHVNEHVDDITARKNGGAGRQVVISESENGVEVHFNKR